MLIHRINTLATAFHNRFFGKEGTDKILGNISRKDLIGSTIEDTSVRTAEVFEVISRNGKSRHIAIPGEDLFFHGSNKRIPTLREGFRVELSTPLPNFSPDVPVRKRNATLGIGLYTTDDEEEAYQYAMTRARTYQRVQGVLTPVINPIIVAAGTRMLDLRGKFARKYNISSGLPPKIAFGFLDYIKDIAELYEVRNRALKHLIVGLSNNKPIEIHTFLKMIAEEKVCVQYDGDRPRYHIALEKFQEYMRLIGYDGVICMQGGEGWRNKQYTENLLGRKYNLADTYVFYGYDNVGTIEDWNNQYLWKGPNPIDTAQPIEGGQWES